LEKPLFSIITVCYNAASLLEGTILSVVRQTVHNFEYIIIDGGSADGTLDIVDKFKDHVNTFISEKDHGIYDAMNKGLKVAKGEFVWFLNAGDQLYDNTILEKMQELDLSDVDVVYGEVMLVDDKRNHIGTRSEITVHHLPTQLQLSDMKRGMIVCHQAFVPRRDWCEPFIDDNLSADIDWVIKILAKKPRVLNSGLILAEYLMGGVSKQKWFKSLRDRWDILRNHFGFSSALVQHIIILFRAVFHRVFNTNKTHY